MRGSMRTVLVRVLLLSLYVTACSDTLVVAVVTDAGGGPEDVSQSIAPLTLTAGFVTPHAINWTWDAEALGNDVCGYTVRFDTDADALQLGAGDIWGVDDDPNLGWRISPFGPNLVHSTTVAALQPNTTYYAVLIAHRTSGSATIVAIGNAQTAAVGQNSVAIFNETLPVGTRQWFSDELSDHAHTGAAALTFNGDGAWTSARLRDMALDISAIPEAAWAHAYLEIYVDMSILHERAYPLHFIFLGLTNSAGDSFGFEYATTPNETGWHRLQVPLSALTNDGSAMTRTTFGATVTEFTFACESPPYRDVFLDDIAIWY